MFYIKIAIYKSIILVLKLANKFIAQTQPIIFSGPNSSLELSKLIIQQKNHHVLIVTDKIINQLGIMNPVIELLESEGVKVSIFDQVMPDPSDEIVNAGIHLAEQQGCDLVLAVGGGSSIDAAKMIAVLANTKQTLKQVSGLLKIKRKGLPLFVLPTTSGTGSEVTMAAVITNAKKQTKSLIISPKMTASATALDAHITQGMPPKVTADTGFDALTHAIEAYLSTYADQQTDQLAVNAIKLIFDNIYTSYKDGTDTDARQAMAIASCYAGMAFNQTNVGYVHAIAHQIGAKYHTPHGMTNAIVLPRVLEFYANTCDKRLAQLANVIGVASDDLTTQQQALQFITAVIELQQKLDIPKKLDCIAQEDIRSLAKAALKEAHYFYPVPKYMRLSQCQAIISQLAN
jgi:alcohol dehydrogenase